MYRIMSTVKLVDEKTDNPKVRAIFEDIMSRNAQTPVRMDHRMLVRLTAASRSSRSHA